MFCVLLCLVLICLVRLFVCVSSYARAGEVASALRALQQMEAAGHKPALAEYNLIVRACVGAQRVTQALDWVRKMERRGVLADMVTFSNILPACRTRFQIAHTVDILRRLWDRDFTPSTKVVAVSLLVVLSVSFYVC